MTTDPMTEGETPSQDGGEQQEDDFQPVLVTVKKGTSVYHLPEDEGMSLCRQKQDFVSTFRQDAEDAGLSLCSTCVEVGDFTTEEVVREIKNVLGIESNEPYFSKEEYKIILDRLGGSE